MFQLQDQFANYLKENGKDGKHVPDAEVDKLKKQFYSQQLSTSFDHTVYNDGWWATLSTTLDYIPLVGWLKSIIEGFVGTTMTGEQLSANEKLQYVLMGAVSVAVDWFTFGTATATVQGTKAVIKEGLKIVAKDVLTGWSLNLGSQALANMDLPPEFAFMAHVGLNIAISRSNIKKSKIDVDDVFDINKYVGDKMNKYGMSLEDFHDLKLKPINELTKKEIKIIKDVRDGIPKITSDTLLQKTFTLEEMDNYLSGKYNTIGGFIAKADGIAGIKDYDDMVESLRLDYLADGKRVFPEGADGYVAIRYY